MLGFSVFICELAAILGEVMLKCMQSWFQISTDVFIMKE